MLSTVYELPWGVNKRWLNGGGLASQILGGWQLSGLFDAQSGQALTIGGNGTLLNTPGNSAFVNLTGDNKVLGGLGPGLLYFDPSVYSLPAAGLQGNMQRHNGPDGPGFWQLDAALFKRFQITGVAVRRVPRRCLQPDQLGALGQPEHGIQHVHRQHVRPDHRYQRQSAQHPLRRPLRVLDVAGPPVTSFRLPARTGSGGWLAGNR